MHSVWQVAKIRRARCLASLGFFQFVCAMTVPFLALTLCCGIRFFCLIEAYILSEDL